MKRLDVLLCKKLGISREYSKEIILAGKCRVSGKVILKPGSKFDDTASIQTDAERMPYVSRGGFKLAAALDSFSINLSGLCCLDIGASTGGFTDCMLQGGAKSVIALDNGHNQLASALHKDKRVISIEGVDIRTVHISDMPFKPNFIAADLSFISLTHIIPKVSELLNGDGRAVLLIKPQFECGAKELDKRGVVHNPRAHISAIHNICMLLVNNRLMIKGLIFSPIKGQNGNIEYLISVKA